MLYRNDCRCPRCDHRLDAHRAFEGNETAEPSAGAASLCAECAGWSVFEEGHRGLYLRVPTPEEQAELESDETCVMARLAVMAHRLTGPLLERGAFN